MKDVNADNTYESWISKHGGYASSMTIRDYFAAQAMQGLIAGADETIREYLDYLDDPMTNLATASYLMADAMLKAREK
jgi:hypothetical protein